MCVGIYSEGIINLFGFNFRTKYFILYTYKMSTTVSETKSGGMSMMLVIGIVFVIFCIAAILGYLWMKNKSEPSNIVVYPPSPNISPGITGPFMPAIGTTGSFSQTTPINQPINPTQSVTPPTPTNQPTTSTQSVTPPTPTSTQSVTPPTPTNQPASSTQSVTPPAPINQPTTSPTLPNQTTSSTNPATTPTTPIPTLPPYTPGSLVSIKHNISGKCFTSTTPNKLGTCKQEWLFDYTNPSSMQTGTTTPKLTSCVTNPSTLLPTSNTCAKNNSCKAPQLSRSVLTNCTQPNATWSYNRYDSSLNNIPFFNISNSGYCFDIIEPGDKIELVPCTQSATQGWTIS